MITVAQIIEDELQKEDVWDSLNGCRRGKHAKLEKDEEHTGQYETTGGIQAWMTQSNFIICLEEVIHYETPTEVLLSLINVLQNNPEYAERVIAIGYDMACTLFGRAKTLIKDGLLSDVAASILIKILHILFVDKWHVRGHTNPMCLKGKNGLFNPYLKKFKKVLFGKNVKTNDQVVEQKWRTINKLRFCKNLSERRFKFTLLDYKMRHNKRNEERLMRAGYAFVDISKVSKTRDLEEFVREMPTMQQLLTDKKYQELSVPKLL